ncbi:CbtA family protein [Haloplanus halobius]|uniref:CbtA family protein n=1 Tax=Haloplanus halobius TaxID=2934938 RepID=UPI00200F73B8|nr:CbtA family protein [Haloplanus sp. XH21]
MLTAHLARGLKAGAVAGLAFGLFMAFVGNPVVAHADAVVEGAHAHGAGGHTGPSLTTLVSVGGGVLWGVLAGAVFGVAFFVLEPAIPADGGVRSYLLAAAGFVTASGAPWLALPPAVPGVEATLPTRTRLLVYGGMMVAGLLACLLAGAAYHRASDRYGRREGVVAAAAPFVGVVLVATLVPASTAPTGAVSPELTAAFRGVVVFGQVTLWAVLAVTHAWLHRRGRAERRRARTPTATTD